MKRQKILPFLAGAFLVVQALEAEQSAEIIDTRGPVQNAGMTVKVDEEGVQALGYVWPKPEAHDSWSAQWIGSSAPAIPDSAAVCLRKEIMLAHEPKKVTAWITSDNYLLYLNGKPAARGPADAGHDFTSTTSGHRFYDCRDLTPLFHQGKNALAAELIGCNGFQFEARIEYADGQTQVIQTDDTWKGISSPYLKNVEFPPENGKPASKGKHILFDAEAEPAGWQLVGFDDAGWPACKAGNPPTATLVLSELPPLMEVDYPFFEITHISGNVAVPDQALHYGHSIVIKGDGAFSVHFNKIMSGRCGIKVKAGKGAVILLSSNETNAPGGRVYELHLRDGVQYFESRDYYALGTINVSVKNAITPVEIEDVSADFLSQPVEYRGSFTCSDEALNTLWKSGRWSTQICMITHHLDSPQHQEPISDYGDYLIADLVNYNSMGSNVSLARQDLRKWAWVMENAKYQTFHTSYILYWLQSLLNYYDYTGDKSVIDELAPNVHAVIDQFSSYIGKNGLISEAPNYMFMDWATVYDDKDPSIKFAVHHPPAVIGQGYMTALFYRALSDAIRVSKLTNDSADVDKYEKLREQIASAYQRELWNGDRGQYCDGKPFATTVPPGKWLPADVQMESFSVQNNAIAVLHDLAPVDQQPAIIETMVANKNWDVTPYYMHFVFDAFAHAGLFDKYGVPRMHEYKVVPETQTVREMGPNKGDYSHGWIASPTYQMSSKILGVVPTSPGFATFAICPTLCNLSFAKGTVPSPHGPIDVDWQRKPDQLDLKVTIPSGTKASVALPVGSAPNPQVTVGGKIVWKDSHTAETISGLRKISQGTYTIEIELDPGAYDFIATRLLPQTP
jgi:hypothetical protein